jgi:uncharacterized protein YdaT
MDEAYNLSPKHFRTKGNVLGIKRGNSLEDLVVSTISDPALQKDFQEKTSRLDNDKPGQNLCDALSDAKFWAKEFTKASKIRDLQEEFIKQHAAEWDNVSADDRLRLLRDYAISVGKALDEKGFWDWFRGNPIATDVRWFTQDPGAANPPTPPYDPGQPMRITWGYTYSGSRDGVTYLNNAFGVGDPKVFDLSKVLNTTTHEIRHQYQQHAVNDPKRFGSTSIANLWGAQQGSDYWIRPIEIDARAFAALSTY